MSKPSAITRWNPFRTGLSRWGPFREMNEIQSRLFPSFLTCLGSEFPEEASEFGEWAPAVDVSEDDDEFTITADLPDVKKEEVKVSVDAGMLTISGERRHEEETKRKKFHHVERRYGKYVRSFRLPVEVAQDKIDAEFKDGTLLVHLPKSGMKKSMERAIEVR